MNDNGFGFGGFDNYEPQFEKIKKSKQKKKKKKSFFKILIWTLIVVAGVFFGYKLFLKIQSDNASSTDTIYNASSSGFKCAGFKNTLLVTTVDGIRMINQKGEDVFEDATQAVSPYIKGMNEPVFLTNEKTVFCYDIKGKIGILFSENGVIKTYNYQKNIIKAKMNKDGKFVTVTEEDGSKGVVRTYNKDGSEMMTWYSGTGYVVDAQISDEGGTMAVLTNEVEKNVISSKVLFFTLDSTEPYMGKIISENTACSLSYTGENAYIICDSCIYFIDKDGDMEKTFEFNDKKMKYFKSFENGCLFLCYGSQTDDGYIGEVYNGNGKQISSFNMDSFLSICDVSDSRLLVLKRKGVLSINSKGRIVKEVSCDFDVKNACYYKDKIAVLSQEAIFFH